MLCNVGSVLIHVPDEGMMNEEKVTDILTKIGEFFTVNDTIRVEVTIDEETFFLVKVIEEFFDEYHMRFTYTTTDGFESCGYSCYSIVVAYITNEEMLCQYEFFIEEN